MSTPIPRVASAAELLDLLDASEAPRGSWVASDADGTLWAADVADLAYRRVVAEGGVKDVAGPFFAQALDRASEPSSGDPSRDAGRLFELYFEDRVDDYVMLEAMVVCFSGWAERDLRAFARAVLGPGLMPEVYHDTRELLGGILERGFRLAVVSGSAEVLVDEAIRMLDLPGEVPVKGAEVDRDGDRLGTKLIQITWEQGKVDAMQPLLQGQPLAGALGDSYGDFPLLLAADRLRALVHARQSLTQRALEHPASSWCEWHPEHTIGGRKIMPRGERTLDG